jgi:membrane protease YdiL (CAAX protease family)
MADDSNPFNRLALILYILIAYIITWGILFPLSFYYNSLSLVSREIWHSFGSIGPTIGAIITIYVIKRSSGLIELKNRIFKYSGIKLLLFALSPLIILFISLLVEALIGIFNFNQFLRENEITNLLIFLVFILPSLCYGFFEEIGWRGFLLPMLQNKYNALISTIILTVIWYFWHLPTFFYRFDLFFALVLMFPLMLTGSIVFTFLFNQSSGSLLMVIILHICYDITTSHMISITTIVVVSTFFIFMDVRAIKVYGKDTLSTKELIGL